MARRALTILGRSLADLWDNFFVLAVMNMLWAMSLLPGLGIVVLLPGWPGLLLGLALTSIFLGPATLALYYVTVEVTRQEHVEIIEFWHGLRRYYRRGWLVGGLNLLFVVLGFFNLAFYDSLAANNSNLGFLIVVWWYILFTWFTMQLYIWPLALRAERFRFGNLLRNTVLATFKYPALTLIISFITGLGFFLSFYLSFLPVMIFGMSYYALVSNKALSEILSREQERAGQSFQVEAPPLPRSEEKPAVLSPRKPPPGVIRRGNVKPKKK